MTIVNGRKLDWRKDPRDDKDRLLCAAPRATLPETVDMTNLVREVRDQDGLGECSGFGSAGQLGAEAVKAGAYDGPFSPDWGYALARLAEKTLPYDDGAYPRDVYEGLLKHGCLLERYHPFDTHLDTTDPRTWPNADKALDWPLDGYARVVDGVDGICTALASGHVVAIGSPWYKAWMKIPRSGLMPEDYEEPAGGHMYYAVGYDRISQTVTVVNSWGEEWGEGGFACMPFSAFDAFKRDGGYDAYVVTVNWRPGGAPEPEPEPESLRKNWKWLVIAVALVGAVVAAMMILK